MTKQEFARKRNFAKFKLLSISLKEIHEVGTDYERTLLEEIEGRLINLRINWDDRSKELGLKVKHK